MNRTDYYDEYSNLIISDSCLLQNRAYLNKVVGRTGLVKLAGNVLWGPDE